MGIYVNSLASEQMNWKSQMRDQFFFPLREIIAISIMIALVSANPIVAREQNLSSESSYTPPRTADGQPDLQRFWTNNTYTPLERPNGITKEFYEPPRVFRRLVCLSQATMVDSSSCR